MYIEFLRSIVVYILGVQVGAHHELRSGVEPQTSTSLLLPRRSASAAKSSSTCGQLLFFKGRPYRFEGLNNQGFCFWVSVKTGFLKNIGECI